MLLISILGSCKGLNLPRFSDLSRSKQEGRQDAPQNAGRPIVGGKSNAPLKLHLDIASAMRTLLSRVNKEMMSTLALDPGAWVAEMHAIAIGSVVSILLTSRWTF